jgi:hypothetical protein
MVVGRELELGRGGKKDGSSSLPSCPTWDAHLPLPTWWQFSESGTTRGARPQVHVQAGQTRTTLHGLTRWGPKLPCPLACQLFVLLPTHVATFPRIFLHVHYPNPDSSNPDQSSPTLQFVKAWFVSRTWRRCPAIRHAAYVYPSNGQWFVEEYWWIWVVLIPVFGGYQKNMWEVIRVSSRFSIWIFQGIRLGDTLYEMWLQGIYNIWNPDRIYIYIFKTISVLKI